MQFLAGLDGLQRQRHKHGIQLQDSLWLQMMTLRICKNQVIVHSQYGKELVSSISLHIVAQALKMIVL